MKNLIAKILASTVSCATLISTAVSTGILAHAESFDNYINPYSWAWSSRELVKNSDNCVVVRNTGKWLTSLYKGYPEYNYYNTYDMKINLKASVQVRSNTNTNNWRYAAELSACTDQRYSYKPSFNCTDLRINKGDTRLIYQYIYENFEKYKRDHGSSNSLTRCIATLEAKSIGSGSNCAYASWEADCYSWYPQIDNNYFYYG